MSVPIRPRFIPLPCRTDDPWDPLLSSIGSSEWIPVCWCPADFPVETFEPAMLQLIHHPEYNSSLILRSEIIEESYNHPVHEAPQLQNFRFVKNIHRRLLPRRPGRNPPIEQNCTFFATAAAAVAEASSHDVADLTEGGASGAEFSSVDCVVLTPKLGNSMEMPYYHPAVFHIAFRYLSAATKNDSDADHEDCKAEGRVCVEVVLLPGAPDPKDVNSRLYRTCLSLLDTVHRYCWGVVTNYRKQAYHDCVISREEYQDLYLIMRERHNYLVDQWHESTDPLKHVYEDIGIATFLMLLWKQGTGESFISDSDSEDVSKTECVVRMPWHRWTRPRGGFLDFGCGNGLLVHILVSEGYAGEGIDLRARNSWRHYPAETRSHLHEHALNPLDLPISAPGIIPAISDPFLKPDTFIIANHADELSPWTPVLATLSRASGFLSIPCCTWSFDTRFDRAQMPLGGTGILKQELPFTFIPPDNIDIDTFVEALRLGGDGGDARKSAYATYRVWLACLGTYCGWTAESDTLRIPSTRNWALVGRERCNEESRSVKNALAIIRQVRERGLFKTRIPEGNLRGH